MTFSSAARSRLAMVRLRQHRLYRAQRQTRDDRRPRKTCIDRFRRTDGFPSCRQVAGRGRTWRPVAARVTSVLGLVSVAKSGVAVVPNPIALGDAEPELVRLFEPVPELTRSWRILAHPDRRRTPAVAAFFDFIADEIAALRPILTG